MDVQLLGPVEVSVRGRPVYAGPRRQRCVLAALAMDAGRPIQVDTLVGRVWSDHPPARVQHALYVYVSRIRRVLRTAASGQEEPVRVLHRAGSYLLELPPDQVDVHRFRRLVRKAGDPACPDRERVTRLRQALDLWRGPPMADLTEDWVVRTREALRQQHVDAAVAWARAHLRLGEAAAVVGPLTDLLVEYPLAESMVAVLMQTLAATGRDSEAIECYAAVRERLGAQLGVDPGPQLRQVHQAVLRGTVDRPSSAIRHRDRTVPAQLPLDLVGFCGRAAELAALDETLPAGPGQPSAAPLVVVSGMAGIGKSALAVHWAHRVADRFPDGQLYVNLRGFDPGGRVVAPTEAVRGFLDALGVPPERIPSDLDGRVGVFRSLLAGKRVLIMLDNAHDTDQVRPLLPGTPTAVVLVTSRNQLTGLVALFGAYPLTLDLLSTADARELLARRIGSDRVTADPDATDAIIAACARLPLALAIAAARARQRGFAPAAVAAELSESSRRLDRLDGGDRSSQIRAVFSWSYTTLTPVEARLFRLLGLHPGPDLSVSAVASLTGHPSVEAHRLLTCLSRANLLTEHAPDRYTFHDLLRAYATDLARTHDPAPTRCAATTRLLDHYTHTAHTADRLLHPLRDPIEPPLGQVCDRVVAEHLADDQHAMLWLTAEHRNLTAALHHAGETGFDTHACQLAWALGTFLTRRGHRQDLATAWRTGLHAAMRLGNLRAQAHAHRALTMASIELGRYEDAHDHAKHALDLNIRTGDRTGQAHTHRNTAYLCWRQGDPHQALHHAQLSLALFRATGDQLGIANELNSLGWYHAEIGDYANALAYCEQSLPLLEQLRDQVGIAYALDSLGYAHHHLGHHAEAISFYQRALALHRHLGDRHDQADTLTRLGNTHHATGDQTAAEEAWRQALDILTDIDHPDAEALRARLDHTA